MPLLLIDLLNVMYCDSGDEVTKGPFIIDEDAKSIVYTREGEEVRKYIYIEMQLWFCEDYAKVVQMHE